MSFCALGIDNQPLRPGSGVQPRTKKVRGETFYRYEIRITLPMGPGKQRQRKQRIWARSDDEAREAEEDMRGKTDLKIARRQHGDWPMAQARYSYRCVKDGKVLADLVNTTAYNIPQFCWALALRPDFDSIEVRLGAQFHRVELLGFAADLPLFETAPPARPRGKEKPDIVAQD